MTPYGAATPLCPSGFAYASLGGLAAVLAETTSRQAARLDGTGPSASLELLDVAHGYVIGAPPGIWPRGARNAARPTCAEAPLQCKTLASLFVDSDRFILERGTSPSSIST